MAFVNQHADFRLSSLGSKTFGTRVDNKTFSGFIESTEILLQGTSCTKRPPLKFISRTAQNDAAFLLPQASRREAEKVLFGISDTVAITIENAETVGTEDTVYKIVDIVDRAYILDKELPVATAGANLVLIIGFNMPLGLYHYTKVPETGVIKYLLVPLVGSGDEVILKNFICKKVKTTTIPDYAKKPVDVVSTDKLNYFFTGASSDSYTIDDKGVFSKLDVQYRADAGVLYNNRLVIGNNSTTTGGLRILLSAPSDFVIPATGAKDVKLAGGHGSSFNWLMGISNSGLVFSTDRGIFLITFDTYESPAIKKLHIYDDHSSNATKPVPYSNFLIYADSNGDNLAYIAYDQGYNDLMLRFLNLQSDLLAGEIVTKMSLVYLNTSPTIIILTESGRVVAAQLAITKENTIAASYCAWFVDYKTNDFIAYRRENANDAILGSFLVNNPEINGVRHKSNYFASLAPDKLPRYSNPSRPMPSLDFYKTFDAELFFPTRVDITVYSEGLSAKLQTKVEYFNDVLVGCKIVSNLVELTIQSISDGRNATATASMPLKSGAVLQASDYEVQTRKALGFKHLETFCN